MAQCVFESSTVICAKVAHDGKVLGGGGGGGGGASRETVGTDPTEQP